MTKKVKDDSIGEDRGQLARGRHRPDVPDSPALERVQDYLLRHNVEHLHGPETVDYRADELVVLVLERNGRPYVEPFIKHYLSLGAKHIVFLDNGSTDGTVEALRGRENVTVLRTTLPYKRYNVAMKRYLIERFGRGRWTVTVDIDELFEYPYSDVVSLKALLGYLNENSYTGVVSYMLDMFPEEPLSEEDSLTESAAHKELHRFYDLSYVRTRNYHDIGDIGNVLDNEEIKILKGGVTRRLFGVSQFLIKHPLVFLDDRLRPMDLSDHWVGNARIADFTGLLLHYKLAGDLYGLVRREMKERKYTNQMGKYDRFFRVLEESPNLTIKNETSRELKSVNDLVGTQIMPISRKYMKFVEHEEQRTGRYSAERWSERLLDAFFSARAEVVNLAGQVEVLRQENQALRRENRERKAAMRSGRADGQRSREESRGDAGGAVGKFIIAMRAKMSRASRGKTSGNRD